MLREGGKILALVLQQARDMVQSGVCVRDIDKHAERVMREKGARPAFKGYRPDDASEPFPAATCISVNETIVHGVPSDYILKEGDLVTIDAGVVYGDLYTDSALTVGVGKISNTAQRLLKVTRKSLQKGIQEAILGNTVGDIGHVIGAYITKEGFSTIKNLVGHGVGHEIHEDPPVYNFGKRGAGAQLKEGLVIAIEPMVSIGSEMAVQQDDGSYVTHDTSLSAHFEHTIAITKKGPIVLTA